MPQTSTLPVTTIATAVLKWQVVETTSLGTRWVIAAFDTREDADLFVERAGRRFEVREDPKWLEARAFRELRRSPDVHPAHEEIEP